MADRGLTIKQEKYAQGLFARLSQREAYKASYNCENMTDKSIDELACVLASNIKVSSRLAELQDMVTERSIWSVEEILKDIKAIALDPDAKRFEKLKALELGGKHLGMFTDKIEQKITGSLNLSTKSDAELKAELAAELRQKGISDAEIEKIIG